MYEFEFNRPTDLSVAVDALKAEGAQALGGGQTLIPVLKQRLAQPTTLVDLSAIESMKGIRRMGDMLVIGGGHDAWHGRGQRRCRRRDTRPCGADLEGRRSTGPQSGHDWRQHRQ